MPRNFPASLPSMLETLSAFKTPSGRCLARTFQLKSTVNISIQLHPKQKDSGSPCSEMMTAQSLEMRAELLIRYLHWGARMVSSENYFCRFLVKSASLGRNEMVCAFSILPSFTRREEIGGNPFYMPQGRLPLLGVLVIRWLTRDFQVPTDPERLISAI